MSTRSLPPGLRTILQIIETKMWFAGPPLTQSLLRHAVQLTTGRLKLDILMGGGHIGSPLARVHFERPATMLMYCISCPTYALQPIDFQEFSHRMT